MGRVFSCGSRDRGGERSWISAAVSLWTTTIGPAHLGQRQRSFEFLTSDVFCSACGADPSNWKTKWQGRGTFTVGQKAEMTNAHEALRKHMQQKAPQKLVDR